MHDLNTIIEMNKPGGVQPKTITADSRPSPRAVKIETKIGELSCEVHTDPAYPGLTIMWNGRQIAVFEQSPSVWGEKTSNMRALLWDTDNENPSTVAPIFAGYGE